MTPTGVGYGDSAGPERRGLSTPGERVNLHSGYSRSLRGFYTPDVLGTYEDSTLRIFSETTGILFSGYSRSLLGFYTPDVLGVYEDSTVGALGLDAPRGRETKTRAVDLGREKVGEGRGCRGRKKHTGFLSFRFVFAVDKNRGPWLLPSQWVCFLTCILVRWSVLRRSTRA